MEKMQEEEFDKINPTYDPNECNHQNIVKLYYLGTHSDYGCLDCKIKSFDLSLFMKNKM